MTAVIELTVIRQQGFNDKGVGGMRRSYQAAVSGRKKSVVFAWSSVFVATLPINSYVAKNNSNILACGDDFGAASFAVAEKGRLLPDISQQIAWERHFRKYN